MSLLDIVILIFILLALRNGYQRGFSLSSLSYIGLVAGTALGAFLAPLMQRALSLDTATAPYLALAVQSVTSLVGYSIGYSLGEPLRLRLIRDPERGQIASVRAAALSGVTVPPTPRLLGPPFAPG